MPDVDQVASILLQTKVAEEAFKEKCKAAEAELTDDYEGVMQLFSNALSNGPLRLRDGGYLYLKTTTSNRALNRKRLCQAIDNVTMDQINQIRREDADAQDLHSALCRAVEENLLHECCVHNEVPCVANQRPKTLEPTQAVRPANDHVESAVGTYRKLTEQMRAVRKHKREGVQQCARVTAEMLPVMTAHLTANKLKTQQVTVVDNVPPPVANAAATALSLPPLPELPMMASVAATAPSTVEPPSKQVMTLQADAKLPIMKAEFKHRTYTSRGKAPNVQVFINQAVRTLPVIHLAWPQSQTDLAPVLEQVREPLLAQLEAMFKATSGQVTEKTKIKIQ